MSWHQQARSEAQRERAGRQMQPIADAIAVDPAKVKDRLCWLVVGCWSIGFATGLVLLGLVWVVVA